MFRVVQELGVSEYSLYKWRKQASGSSELAVLGNGKMALSVEQQENARLKKGLEHGLQRVAFYADGVRQRGGRRTCVFDAKGQLLPFWTG